MRIVSVLIAVLGLAAVVRSSHSNEYNNQTFSSKPSSLRSGGRYRNLHKKSEGYEACCPAIEELVEPEAGKNHAGMLVELYRDKDYKQRFYEISCKEGVLDSPCKYVNKKVESRCIQKYSYTYALVKNSPELKNNNSPTFPTREDGAAYVLDYIQIRSGCSCEVKKRKKRSKQKRLFPKN